MENTFVTGKTLVGEIVSRYPEAVEALRSCGMHCLGCPASQAETLEDACSVHGLRAEDVIASVNAKIAEHRA